MSQSNGNNGRPLGFAVDRLSTSSSLYRITPCRVFLDSLRESSAIFGNSRKMFGNVRLPFGTILENLRKRAEISENQQKRRHMYVYIIEKKVTH